jgi:hypothetical protein
VYSAPQATERYGALIISSADISFLQAGSGAVVRTAQSKMRDVVSVMDFGAVGDGVTDDTVAIQAAFSSGAKRITAEAGAIYAVNGQISIASQLEFDGQGCTFIATLAAGVRFMQVLAAASIKNLTLDFNDSYALNAINFPTANVGSLELVNVTVRDIYDLDTTTLTIPINFNADRNEIRFDGVTLRNIKKRSDGIPNSIEGGIEGIYVYVQTSNAVGGGGYMQNITIENIRTVDSSGADIEDICNAIYLAYGLSLVDRRARININNVKGLDFGRRLFKIQADDVFISNVFAESVTFPALVGIGLQDYDTIAAFNVKVKNAVLRGAMRFAVACSVTDAVLDGIDCNVSLRGVTNPYGSDAIGIAIGGDGLEIVNSHISADIGLASLRASTSYAGSLKNIQIADTQFKQRVANSFPWLIQETTGTADIDSMSFSNIVVDCTLFPATMSVGSATKNNGTLNMSNITVVDNDATLNGGTGLFVDAFAQVNIAGYVHVNKDAGSQIFRTLRCRTCTSVQLDSITLQAKPNIANVSFENTSSLIATNIYVNPLATYSIAVATTAASRFAALRRDKVLFSDTTSSEGAVFAQEFSTGTTARRPTAQLSEGQTYWDSTLSKPIWWNGSAWEDATGATV